MESHGFLFNALVFLLAAVICVPVSKRLGFGSVLGYLMAGLVIGPWGLKLITDVQDIMHFSEFGIVLLLFLIGLELEIKKLWAMRMLIFGMGGLQILLNMAAIFSIAMLFQDDRNIALLAGMGFALSSTAIALQILNEKKMLGTTSGNSAFSILLFQDMAVIPMIAILPLLSNLPTTAKEGGALLAVAKAVVILAGLIILGRPALRFALKRIASLHIREIFTAFSLLLVIAMAALMQSMHISMALGAFLAGVLLADSEYRHALQTDIEPFKGLLLGLFFISVGMSVDIGSVLQNPGLVVGLTLLVMVVKFVVHFAIGKVFYIPKRQVPFFALVLAQVGEFAFVLFGAAKAFGILSDQMSGLLIAVTALSMLVTPLSVMVFDIVAAKIGSHRPPPEPDHIRNDGHPVIIAGFGRYGQIVGRLLFANKINATVLDFEPEQIELLRRFGFKIYYGDATRVDLLEAAGAAQAKILVVAIDDVDSALKLVEVAQQNFPHLKIYSRARNLDHMYKLMEKNLKVHQIERETFESSLKLGGSVLRKLGLSAEQTASAMSKFRNHNIEMIKEMQPERANQKLMISKAIQAREDLAKMFEEEAEILHQKEASPANPA